MEYYSSTKRNEVVIHVTMAMNLKTLCYVKEAMQKRSHVDSIYMRHPKYINPQRYNAYW